MITNREYIRNIAMRLSRFPMLKMKLWVPDQDIGRTIAYLLVEYPHLLVTSIDKNEILIRFPQCRV